MAETLEKRQYPNAGADCELGRYRTGEKPEVGDRVWKHDAPDFNWRLHPPEGEHVVTGVHRSNISIDGRYPGDFGWIAARFDLISRAAPVEVTPNPPEVEGAGDDETARGWEIAGKNAEIERLTAENGRLKQEVQTYDRASTYWWRHYCEAVGRETHTTVAADAEFVRELDAMRDALWVCMEHNRLHHGENHNTVIQAGKVLAGWKPEPPKPVLTITEKRREDGWVYAWSDYSGDLKPGQSRNLLHVLLYDHQPGYVPVGRHVAIVPNGPFVCREAVWPRIKATVSEVNASAGSR